MKHLAMNSASSARADEDAIFFKVLRRLCPRRPPVWNLRIFSRLRLIFSFFALTRQASRAVEDLTPNVGIGAKACNDEKEREEKMLADNIVQGSFSPPTGEIFFFTENIFEW